MREFAQESGKSKGQFYTPAEVSRILAKVIGIDKATRASYTVYDPTCGSGSLLIRAADEAPHGITIYGQEYDPTTAGLATMNLVLHNKSTGTIASANTLADPTDNTGIKAVEDSRNIELTVTGLTLCHIRHALCKRLC